MTRSTSYRWPLPSPTSRWRVVLVPGLGWVATRPCGTLALPPSFHLGEARWHHPSPGAALDAIALLAGCAGDAELYVRRRAQRRARGAH